MATSDKHTDIAVQVAQALRCPIEILKLTRSAYHEEERRSKSLEQRISATIVLAAESVVDLSPFYE